MFNNIVYELQHILNESGKEFAVFNNFAVEQEKGDDLIDKYSNIGVLYVNYGTIKLLKGNKGLQGSMQLDLIMEIAEGVKTESVIQSPLQALMANTNGTLYDLQDGSQSQYVLQYHLPTTNGNVGYTTSGKKYVVYSLPIDLYLTSGLLMGESVTLTMSNGVVSDTLENVVRLTLAPSVQLDAKTMLNQRKTTVTPLAKGWGANVVFYYEREDAVHQAIYKSIMDTPFMEWSVTIGDKELKGNNTDTTKIVVLHDSSVSFERGQPTMITLSMSETE